MKPKKKKFTPKQDKLDKLPTCDICGKPATTFMPSGKKPRQLCIGCANNWFKEKFPEVPPTSKKQDRLDTLLHWLWQSSQWNKGRVQQIVKEKIEKMIRDTKKKSV